MITLNKFRPMKSATPTEAELQALPWPMWGSPKIDGIRCVIHPSLGPVTNTLKSIPNSYVRDYLNKAPAQYLDGELVVGEPSNPKSFHATTSGIMSFAGEPNFTYLVFDDFSAGNTCGFGIRKEDARERVERCADSRIQFLEQVLLHSYEDMLGYEEMCVGMGYEGVMLRHPQGFYKFGRSTMRQAWMVKVKRFIDDEAVIIDWEALERNNNTPEINALGLQRRGHSQAGKTYDDTRVGRFLCRGVPGSRWDGVEFWIGSGLDDDDRLRFREVIRYIDNLDPITLRKAEVQNSNYPIGKTITFKYQAHGNKDAPRTPIWKGIRRD